MTQLMHSCRGANPVSDAPAPRKLLIVYGLAGKMPERPIDYDRRPGVDVARKIGETPDMPNHPTIPTRPRAACVLAIALPMHAANASHIMGTDLQILRPSVGVFEGYLDYNMDNNGAEYTGYTDADESAAHGGKDFADNHFTIKPIIVTDVTASSPPRPGVRSSKTTCSSRARSTLRPASP